MFRDRKKWQCRAVSSSVLQCPAVSSSGPAVSCSVLQGPAVVLQIPLNVKVLRVCFVLWENKKTSMKTNNCHCVEDFWQTSQDPGKFVVSGMF